ncbi:gene transfer agent family protein [Microvirga antarctica]|uniref:gene transfer agent family protein n=1 Tax=Microvirga antarctica TaxID=2819233 RepID=UPI001B310FCE|nr:gene transfer agent family protein [Microvirga antarctica]
MANPRRGEVTLRLNDETYTLCLTLGALAELEDAFGVQDLPALAERFGTGRLSSRDLLAILGLGLRGGGHAVSDKALSEMAMSDGIEPLAEAVVALLVNTFGGAPAEGLNPNPPEPQDA